MKLFFGKRMKKSTKPFIILKFLFSIALLFMLVMMIFKDYDINFLWLFTLIGVLSIIGGIESYLEKEDKRVYLLDFGFAVIWFILAFIFRGVFL